MKRLIFLLLLLLTSCMSAAGPSRVENTQEITRESGFSGGVIVNVGCENPRALIELQRSGIISELNGTGCMVQGLDTSDENILAAREAVIENKLQGKVTVREFDGKELPYVDNTINLLMAGNNSRISRDEVTRVLAPNGTAYLNGEKIEKSRPENIDEWTHFHHDPAGTMVGTDRVVGPPRRIQWMGEPKWLVNHDFMTIMHAMVSAGNRVFYVTDEGLRQHVFLPAKWVLVARDAFNGTVLWKQYLEDWHPRNWPLKSGPGHNPRKLVASGDRVYTAPGFTAPLTAYDARTGRKLIDPSPRNIFPGHVSST